LDAAVAMALKTSLTVFSASHSLYPCALFFLLVTSESLRTVLRVSTDLE